ncbi:hypothetical protein GNI_184500 [Gregarina niphandrodes]|uniref:Uncharacterized protein n=1 Tax=Gregarina niphandrodes TaxID=110365 RepID=A0A023AWN9_GRENI|nr:hypothetical protein GNI_184500 [Gregarina niphandrodes]EZG43156.1 hypothetical protein GNI_184500 [Gregarina niphandrodes]|eukprot:XP_011133586.1 hypothetical protein GNI_184500 [Gregarina niphandrodes]
MFDDSDVEGNDPEGNDPLSNDGGTIFDRFSSSDADKKRVRHLIKDLGGDVTFKPLNEEEFDELLIKWKRVASSMMYSPAELKEVIILRTTSVNQDLIARRGLMNLPFQEFVDAFAAHLFPFSDEINLVCARLQHQHGKADALQVIEDFLLLRSRFKALCRRGDIAASTTVTVFYARSTRTSNCKSGRTSASSTFHFET